MIKRRLLYLLALLGFLVLYLAYQQWLAWIVLVGLVFLPWFSLVVSLPAMLCLRISLDIRGAVTAGTPAVLEVTAASPMPLPLYRCRVRVTHSLTGEDALMEPGDPLPTQHCGKLVLLPDQCCVYDYLGLFRIPVGKISATSLLLRPRLVEGREPKALQRYIAGAWKPKPGGGFAENHEMRLYRPGDSMNQVHWKLSAKTGKLMIREAMEPARGRVIMTLDLKGDPATLDKTLERLVFLGRRMVEFGLRYTLIAHTAQGRRRWEIGCESDLGRAVDQLLACAPATEGSILSAPLIATWRCHIGGAPDEA